MHCLERLTVSAFELFTGLYQIKKRDSWNLNDFLELNIPQGNLKKSLRARRMRKSEIERGISFYFSFGEKRRRLYNLIFCFNVLFISSCVAFDMKLPTQIPVK